MKSVVRISSSKAKARTRHRQHRAKVALKRLDELTVRRGDAVIPTYERGNFGHGWTEDGDGQNERAEVLIAAHRSGRGKEKADLAFASEHERRVVSGRWRCRFSGEWVTDAGDLDIDHLVPLAEAWASGAHAWDKDRRSRYANGVGVRSWKRSWLLPVRASLNRGKGAKRPDEWLPPNTRYHLHYAADWIATKRHWQMSVSMAEAACLRKILEAEL